MSGTPAFGWRFHLARALYGGLHAAALLPSLPLLGLHPRVRGGVAHRLGCAPLSRGPEPVWFHGSSAGDLHALAPLIAAAQARGLPAVLSTRTATGEEAARHAAPGCALFRAPADLRLPVSLALGRVRPRALVLECLELWPWLVSACLARGVPVVLVNGRLSPRSLAGYGRAPWLFGPCLAGLSLVTALSDGDAARFIQAGVPRERVMVLPSSKHAVGEEPPDPLAGEPGDGPFRLVLGSVHPAEEEALIPWMAWLKERLPGLELVVAPRYPHRARRVARRLTEAGLDARLSSAGAAPVTVLDRMGELAAAYRGAALAFVGGSLVTRGGHNVVEPAREGVPVCIGPSHRHVAAEVARLTEAGAAEIIQDGESLALAALRLHQDPGGRRRAGLAAVGVARELHRGGRAVARELFRLIPARGEGPG